METKIKLIADENVAFFYIDKAAKGYIENSVKCRLKCTKCV